MRSALDVLGVRVAIESDVPDALRGVAAEFSRFATASAEPPHVAVRLALGKPELPRLASGRRPRFLFRAGGNAVHVAGGVRYVLHRGDALTIFDLRADSATILAESAGALREIAYLFVMSRVGARLDRAGRHRAHALSIALGGRAALFLAGSGVGKTTLGLSLMARIPAARWMADEIPILDRDLRVWPFPLPPRLVDGAPIPWPPPPLPLERVARTKPPAKVKVALDAIAPRIASRPAPLGAVFLCSRRRGPGPTTVARASFARALAQVAAFVVFGRDFPHTKAFWLDLGPRGLAREARVRASRAALAARMLASVPAYDVSLSSDPEEGAAAVAEALLRAFPPDRGVGGTAADDDERFLEGKGERPCSGPTGAI